MHPTFQPLWLHHGYDTFLQNLLQLLLPTWINFKIRNCFRCFSLHKARSWLDNLVERESTRVFEFYISGYYCASQTYGTTTFIFAVVNCSILIKQECFMTTAEYFSSPLSPGFQGQVINTENLIPETVLPRTPSEALTGVGWEQQETTTLPELLPESADAQPSGQPSKSALNASTYKAGMQFNCFLYQNRTQNAWIPRRWSVGARFSITDARK